MLKIITKNVTTHLIKNPLLILCVLFLAKTQCSQSFKNAKLKKIIYDFFHCVLTADLLFERCKLLIIHHFYLINTEASVRDFFFAYLAPLRDNFYGC